MRVLVISCFGRSPAQPHGGVFIERRVEAIRRQGVSVDVASLGPVSRPSIPGFPTKEPFHWPADHVPSEFDPRPVPTSPSSLLLVRLGRGQRVSREFAKRVVADLPEQYDLIVGHGAYSLGAAGVAHEVSRATGIPYIPVAHGSDINNMRPGGKSFIRQLFTDAAASIFVSNALRETAEREGIPTGRSHVITNGVDRSIFHYQEHRQDDKLRVLFVGNLTKEKGADLLPSVMSHLLGSGRAIELTVVGAGPLQSSLENQLGPETRFVGSVDQPAVAQLMRNSDVLAILSRSEGFGCVALEARSCGTPVVATRVGGLPEAVDGGGRLVPASREWDAKVFAQSLIQVVQNPDRAKNANTAGVQSWDDIAEKEVAVYRSLVGS